MSNDAVNEGRRRMLIGFTAATGAVGAVAVATPFVQSWQPSARAQAAGAPVEVDTSKLEPGAMMTVKWRGKPVWVVRRTDEQLDYLSEVESQLRDPSSKVEQQPAYVDPQQRSIDPSIFVVVGICTHLGCSPKYRPEVQPSDLGQNWYGGFYCPCHGSKFDLAGRVYQGVPAPTNLQVPPYRYVNDSVIEIGVDKEVA